MCICRRFVFRCWARTGPQPRPLASDWTTEIAMQGKRRAGATIGVETALAASAAMGGAALTSGRFVWSQAAFVAGPELGLNRLEIGDRGPGLGRFGSPREKVCVVGLDLASEPTTQYADLQGFYYGSEGTRTRDLRRDRPSRARQHPATNSSGRRHLQVLPRRGRLRSAWLRHSSNRRLGHEWATETCLLRQRCGEDACRARPRVPYASAILTIFCIIGPQAPASHALEGGRGSDARHPRCHQLQRHRPRGQRLHQALSSGLRARGMSGESGHVLADASSLLEPTLDRGAEVDSAVQPGDGRLLRGRRERPKRAWG